MIIYSLLYLLLSNAVTLRREKSTQIVQSLLLLLLLGFFFYFVCYYILGWNYFSLHLSFILILLLRLIDYSSNFYYINKIREGHKAAIKPYSTMNNIAEVFTDIVLGLLLLIISVRSIITLIVTLIVLPVSVLLSVVFGKIQSIIIYTFTSTTYYKILKNTYYKEGLSSLLIELATLIYYKTTCYIQRNLYLMLVLQSIFIYQASSGHNFWLIIYMIIHLPFFIISIVTYITIINKNFYKQHPLLFTLYICACLLLLLVFIFLFVIIYSLISHLIDDYFIQAKSNDGNSKGNDGGSDSGPGGGPEPGGGGPAPDPYVFYPYTDKKKGKEKEQVPETEHTSHVNKLMVDYVQKSDQLEEDLTLSKRELRNKLDQLKHTRNKSAYQSSSSYSDDEAIKSHREFKDKYREVLMSGDTDAQKKIKNLQLMDEENSSAARRYKKKYQMWVHLAITEISKV